MGFIGFCALVGSLMVVIGAAGIYFCYKGKEKEK
jgi:hypothetical protein